MFHRLFYLCQKFNLSLEEKDDLKQLIEEFFKLHSKLVPANYQVYEHILAKHVLPLVYVN